MRFRCLVGLHKWKYTDNHTRRACACCPKSQHLDEEAVIDWTINIWLDD